MGDTCGSAPSLRSIFPSRLQTLRAFPTFQRNSGQSSSYRSKILPRYLKFPTPSIHSASSSPVRLNTPPWHRLVIEMSFLHHRIYVFRSHRFVRWCLSSRPTGMCIPHRSQWGSGSLPYCTTDIRSNKCLYMKYSIIQPALCATAGQPVTGHLTVFSNWGEGNHIIASEKTQVSAPKRRTVYTTTR